MNTQTLRRRRARRHALTLVEAMMSAMILAVVAVAASQAIVAGQMQTYDAMYRQRAMTLADALMDEILRLPYEDPDGESTPGPETGEARTTFDNIDDFHSFAEAGSLTKMGKKSMTAAVRDASGTPYADSYQCFRQSVTVVASTQNVAALGGDITGVLVTVTVQNDETQSWSIESFVPNPTQ